MLYGLAAKRSEETNRRNYYS